MLRPHFGAAPLLKAMKKETEAILNMLNREEDLKFDILDRFVGRKIEDEEVFKEAIEDAAFALEDEVRASARLRFIDVSMWTDIVMPYIEKADYREISEIWLSSVRERRNTGK